MEKQYRLDQNILTLKVKKAPLFVRSVMFVFTFLFFLLPLFGLAFRLSMGKGLHIVNFIALFVFGLLGFYMLRISLWNTHGRETITFNDKNVQYLADYGWFRDGEKQKEYSEPLILSKKQIGYNDDDKSVLVIGLKEPITCVTKMSNVELEELINLLGEMEMIQRESKSLN